MEKLNLWKVDDPEVESFFDTIKGTATAENKLLTKQEILAMVVRLRH
jgi:hypothetical protein